MAKQKYKVAFKTTRPTGRYRSFATFYHEVRINGKYIGRINDEDFRIRFQVIKKDIKEDKNENCPWKWVLLMYRPESLDDAKKWITENIDHIANTFTLNLI